MTETHLSNDFIHLVLVTSACSCILTVVSVSVYKEFYCIIKLSMEAFSNHFVFVFIMEKGLNP